MDRRVRSGEILVGRERETALDSLATDNGVLFGQLSVRVGIGTAERQLRVPTHSRLLCLSGLHGYPEVTAQRLKGSFADIAPQKLMKALLSDSRVETILKSGRKRDLKHFIDHPQDLDFCWPSYKIVLRQKYRITDIGIWVDYLRMLDRCGKDLHNAHYVCPADLKAEHDKYQNKVRILQEQEKRKEQMKRARENEARLGS